MDKVIFKNNILYVINDNMYIPIQLEYFEKYYHHEVLFDNDLKVENFIEALKPFFDKIDSHFIAYSKGFKINIFYEEMLKPNTELYSDIDYVEMYWNSYIIDSEFEWYGSFHGVSLSENINYGMVLSPLNRWKHLPFKLNTKFECYDERGNIVDSTPMILFSSNKQWKLYDLIKYFIYELTFYGYPKDIEQMVNEFNEIKDEFVNDKFSSYKMELYLLESELAEAEEREDFELCKELDIKIKKFIIKLKELGFEEE